jgi:hypothetical protein
LASPDIILNGRVVSGRSHQTEDGLYDSLDLVQAEPGSVVEIVTSQGEHTLMKGDDSEHGGVLENWARLRAESALGVTTLVLLHHNPNGNSFRTPRVVLRKGLELGALDSVSEHPNVIVSLGIIASIGYRPASKREDAPLPMIVSHI